MGCYGAQRYGAACYGALWGVRGHPVGHGAMGRPAMGCYGAQRYGAGCYAVLWGARTCYGAILWGTALWGGLLWAAMGTSCEAQHYGAGLWGRAVL